MTTRAGAGRMREDTALGEEIFTHFDGTVVARLWVCLRPRRAALCLALASVLAYTLIQVAIPLVVRYAVDSMTGRSAWPLQWLLSAFALLVVLNSAFNFLQEWVAARLAQEVIFDLRRAMFSHLQRVSLATLDRTQVGRLMARLAGDVNALQEFMENSVSAVGDLFLLLGIVGVLLWMDLTLGLFTIALLPVLVVLRLLWIPWARRSFARARQASSSVNAALAENINGIRTVQESRREGVNFGRYEERARENLQAQIGSSRTSQGMVPLVDVLTGVAMAIVVVAGGQRMMSGDLGVGVMVAYIFYVQRFFDPIRTLSMQYTVMQRAMAAGQRIFETLDIPLTLQDSAADCALTGVEPSVSLEHVTFGYADGQPVLHDVSLNIEPYETVALVGPTGSGKTTVAALIHRFHDVWSGAVKVGGHDVRHLRLDTLARQVGIVLQEPFLFSGTIADNIRYGLPNASLEQVMAAATAVRAHDFIERLPQGYATLLGQRGRSLSVGQRQLLSFARALLADPKILILDEATANIDSHTEQEIQHAMRLLRQGRTTIIIAHRLATVRDTNRIIVMRAGRVVEQGSHDELRRRPGLYAQLLASSHTSFDEGG